MHWAIHIHKHACTSTTTKHKSIWFCFVDKNTHQPDVKNIRTAEDFNYKMPNPKCQMNLTSMCNNDKQFFIKLNSRNLFQTILVESASNIQNDHPSRVAKKAYPKLWSNLDKNRTRYLKLPHRFSENHPTCSYETKAVYSATAAHHGRPRKYLR